MCSLSTLLYLNPAPRDQKVPEAQTFQQGKGPYLNRMKSKPKYLKGDLSTECQLILAKSFQK